MSDVIFLFHLSLHPTIFFPFMPLITIMLPFWIAIFESLTMIESLGTMMSVMTMMFTDFYMMPLPMSSTSSMMTILSFTLFMPKSSIFSMTNIDESKLLKFLNQNFGILFIFLFPYLRSSVSVIIFFIRPVKSICIIIWNLLLILRLVRLPWYSLLSRLSRFSIFPRLSLFSLFIRLSLFP